MYLAMSEASRRRAALVCFLCVARAWRGEDQAIIAKACAERVPGWARREVSVSKSPMQGAKGIAYVARVSPAEGDGEGDGSVPSEVFAVLRGRRRKAAIADPVASEAAAHGCGPRLFYNGKLGGNTSRYITMAEIAGDQVGLGFLMFAGAEDARLAKDLGRLVSCVHAIRPLPRPPPPLITAWLGMASVRPVKRDAALDRTLEIYRNTINREYKHPTEGGPSASASSDAAAYYDLFEFAFANAANWTSSRMMAEDVNVHGDFHVRNVLVRGEPPTLKIIDYENAHKGGAITDLAPYSRTRPRSNVVAMLTAYHKARFGAKPSPGELDRMLFDLEVGLAHQMLDRAPHCLRKNSPSHIGLDWACPPPGTDFDFQTHLADVEALYRAIHAAARGDAALWRAIVDRGVLVVARARETDAPTFPTGRLFLIAVFLVSSVFLLAACRYYDYVDVGGPAAS